MVHMVQSIEVLAIPASNSLSASSSTARLPMTAYVGNRMLAMIPTAIMIVSTAGIAADSAGSGIHLDKVCSESFWFRGSESQGLAGR